MKRFHKLTAWLLTLAILMIFMPSFALTSSAAENFYIVAGSPELFGVAWDPAFEENKLSLADDGNYYKTYNNVAAGTYFFKITTNGAWDNGEYNLEGDATFGGTEASVTVSQDGSIVIIGFDGTKALVEVIPPSTCTCEKECTKDNVNSECTVCSVDLNDCTGVHTHNLDYKYSDTEHWHECTAEDCPDKEGSKTNLTSHSYDNDTDTTCVCGYTRTIDNDNGDTSDTPVITSFTINSDSPAYNAETNTFYYDAEHTLDLLISGKNLEGQRIYIALCNSAGIHTFFLYTAKHATDVGLQFSKRTLDNTLKSLAEDGVADIVYLWVHLYDVDDEIHHFPLNVLPISYTVTFDANGGNTETATMTTVDGKLEALPTPTRSGYTFDGWFDAETGGNKVTYDTMFFDDTTIYAQWTALPPKITDIYVDEASPAYNSETNTFTVTKDTPFVVYITGEYFENIDNTFLEETSFGFVPSVDDSENALGNALSVFKYAGFFTIDADESIIKLTFDYNAMKAFISEYGKFEGICYGDIENIKEENIKSVNITLAKYDPTYAEPTVITGLVYNGTEQALMIPGTAEGGTMKYYIGTTQATAEVPARASAGEYTVTCIVAGDKIHNNIVVGEYTVTIAKKTIDSAIVLTAPVKNTAPQTEITGNGYTATVTWSPDVTDKFSYNTEYTATVTITPDENHTVAGIAVNGYTVEGAKTVTNEENSNIITVTYEKTGGRPSGGSSSNTTTTTTKNEDGSTTKVTENKATGTKTEVTTNADGSTTTVETSRDGTVTTTEKDKDGNTTITVEKPDGTVSVTKTDKNGKEITEIPKQDDDKNTSISFDDVFETDWYYKDVEYAVENGLFTGTTATTFAPNIPLTRAMLVTVLYRAEGEPEMKNAQWFEDVEKGQWYSDAVAWATFNGITMGYGNGNFGPDDNITREQIAAIMHRYAQYKGYDVSVGESTNILSYNDVHHVSEYAISAMQYAVGSGLIRGKTETTLNPLENATRAEAAAILERFIKANK